MKNREYWIKNLEMEKHPEGGYYALTYECQHRITDKEIDKAFQGTRSLATSIYFLIHDEDVSNFHKLESDEMWYYHDGSPLVIAVITPNGDYVEHRLGLDIKNGETPQVLVPAGSIFGSFIKGNSGYSLVGCMVSYGFDFNDFELFDRKVLLKEYPQYESIICKLTRV